MSILNLLKKFFNLNIFSLFYCKIFYVMCYQMNITVLLGQMALFVVSGSWEWNMQSTIRLFTYSERRQAKSNQNLIRFLSWKANRFLSPFWMKDFACNVRINARNFSCLLVASENSNNLRENVCVWLTEGSFSWFTHDTNLTLSLGRSEFSVNFGGRISHLTRIRHKAILLWGATHK